MNQIIERLEKNWLKKEVPVFQIGDTVRIHSKVIEGEKSRTQIFEGVVIAKRGGGHRQMFTVRKVSFGIGVERVFPLHSPIVQKVEVVRSGHVRRSKLYYLRELQGKAARLVERDTRTAKPGAGQKAVQVVSEEPQTVQDTPEPEVSSDSQAPSESKE